MGLTDQRQRAKNTTDYRQNEEKITVQRQINSNRQPTWSDVIGMFVFRKNSILNLFLAQEMSRSFGQLYFTRRNHIYSKFSQLQNFLCSNCFRDRSLFTGRGVVQSLNVISLFQARGERVRDNLHAHAPNETIRKSGKCAHQCLQYYGWRRSRANIRHLGKKFEILRVTK